MGPPDGVGSGLGRRERVPVLEKDLVRDEPERGAAGRPEAGLDMLDDPAIRPETMMPVSAAMWKVSLRALQSKSAPEIAAARKLSFEASLQSPGLAVRAMMVLSMLLFGGPTLRDFLVVLLTGVVVGTYSSIFIASGMLVAWETGGIGKAMSAETKRETIDIGEPLPPGASRDVEFPEVARQATVRLFARADREEGYGNLDLTLVEARIVDNADSPYADAVATAKAMLRAVDAREVPSIRAMAARLRDNLAPYYAPPAAAAVVETPAPAAQTVEVVAAPEDTREMYLELRDIEDLLTGTEEERREGMDRLHQLVRKLRP